MGLRARTAEFLRGLSVRLSAEVPAAAARKIYGVQLEDPKGFARPTTKHDELYRIFQIERGRFAGYRDYWAAICESQIVDQAHRKLAEDSTAEPFDIRCRDSRAEKEMWALFDRVQYFGERRTVALALLNAMGDVFHEVYVDRPLGKRNIGEVTGVGLLPEYQMFRLASPKGTFDNLGRAFLQMPGIDLVYPGAEGSMLWNGTKFYAGGATYSGLAGRQSGYGIQQRSGEEVISFAAEEIIHSRRQAGWQPVRTGYGVGALRSNPMTHNIVMAAVQDLAIGRKMATMRTIAHEFGPETTPQAVREYQDELEKAQVGPATEYVIRGGKIYSVDRGTRDLASLEDVDFALEMLMLGLGYPLALAGFRSHRLNGLIMDRMELRLKRTIRGQNQMEEVELIRPLIDRQMALSGKLGVEYELRFPPISLEDDNKRSKRVLSEVGAQVKSRKRAAIELNSLTDVEWDEEFAQMEFEAERLGPPAQFKPAGESLNKGKKGVETQSTATQDIAPTENIGG